MNGRNQITWAERIELDVEYVRRWSLLLDFEVVMRTLLVVVAGKRGRCATVKRRGGTWKGSGEKAS